MKKNKQKKTRQEINELSRLLKKKRKHKGLPSGSRFVDANKQSSNKQGEIKDPRIGSKKPVPLVASHKTQTTQKPSVPSKPLQPKLELEQLENNPYLEALLDKVENDIELTDAEQQKLDKMLDRIDYLMKLLGYSDDDIDDEDETEKKEDIMGLLRR